MNYKPFDLEAAKRGEKIQTKCGYPARIICSDRKDNAYPIVALVTMPIGQQGEYETPITYAVDGTCCDINATSFTLVMAQVEMTSYVNLYRDENGNNITGKVSWCSETAAVLHNDEFPNYLTTAKMTWFE